MTQIVLAHGFNVHDGGQNTTDKLIPHLEAAGHQVIQADYGYFGLFGVRFFNKHIAKVIAGMTPEDSIGIGHSNGCAILVEAARQDAPFKRLILINPALDRDTEFPEQIERVDVFHNMDDFVVTTSKWLPWHPWGDMGRLGYNGVSLRVVNHETKRRLNVSGHSAVFEKAAELVAWFGLIRL